MIQAFLDFIFPKKCVFCGSALPVGEAIGVCAGCVVKIPYFKGDYLFDSGRRPSGNSCDRIICALEYAGIVRRSMSRYKFHERRDYGNTYAAILSERVIRLGGSSLYDFVACVPLSRKRLRERGYNQAAVLAKYTASFLGLPFAGDLLVRKNLSLRQSTLRRTERYTNVKGAFSVNEKEARALYISQHKNPEFQNEDSPLAGARILLVDDIATSMATINACAAALKANGASEVVGAVLAAPLF